MKNVLIFCASDSLAQQLITYLEEQGYSVFIHNPFGTNQHKNTGYWVNDLNDLQHIPLHYVVNLSCDSLFNKKWSERNKNKMIDDCVFATRDLYEWLKSNNKRPLQIITASSVGYYGICGFDQWDHVCDENDLPQPFFLSKIYQELEYEALCFDQNTKIMRFGYIFEKEYGPLKILLKPILKEVYGYTGGGYNPVPWIHVNDACRAIEFLFKSDTNKTFFNAVAPDELVQKVFCDTSCQHFNKKPKFNKVPYFVFRLIYGEKADLITNGKHCMPISLINEGFKFKYERYNLALINLSQHKKTEFNSIL